MIVNYLGHCLAGVYTARTVYRSGILRDYGLYHTVHTSNMQYAFGVQVYGEVLYLEFYSVFSESYPNHEILLCKRLQ